MDIGDRRLRRRLVLLAWGLAGCGPGDRRAADLQLDVVGSKLLDTDRVRICIADALIDETSIGDGRIALAGLPAEGPIEVQIDALLNEESVGQIEPISLDEDEPWKTAAWKTCSPPCSPCNIENPSPQASTESSRLLAIHFID